MDERTNRLAPRLPIAAAAGSAAASAPAARLLPTLREAIRVRHYSLRTEQVYVGWVRRYVHFHSLRHPRELGAPEVQAFLSHLASERNVSASTQGQAKSALLFLYKHVLGVELPWLDEVVSAKATRRLPVVLTQREVRELLMNLEGGVTGWSRRCCMAPECACSKACACASRTWSSSAARSSCVKARAARTGSPCCRRT